MNNGLGTNKDAKVGGSGWMGKAFSIMPECGGATAWKAVM